MSSDDQMLHLSMRPRRLSELVGQGKAVKPLLTQVASRRLPRTILLEGDSGGGKTTISRILALSWQLPLERFGEPTDDEWAAYDQHEIQEINASSVNGIEELGKVAKNANFQPLPPSVNRVIILDEAHRISSAAQNLLLKPFEEPAKSTRWIICTTDPGKLLPTLLRRCYRFKVAPLTTEGITKLIARAAKRTKYSGDTSKLAAELDFRGVSSPSLVVSAFEKFLAGASVKTAIESANPKADGLRVCRAFTKGDWPAVATELKASTPEEIRGIRLGLMGYLRAIVLSGGNLAPKATRTIIRLSATGPYEEPAYLAWVCAVLFEECKGYK